MLCVNLFGDSGFSMVWIDGKGRGASDVFGWGMGMNWVLFIACMEGKRLVRWRFAGIFDLKLAMTWIGSGHDYGWENHRSIFA